MNIIGKGCCKLPRSLGVQTFNIFYQDEPTKMLKLLQNIRKFAFSLFLLLLAEMHFNSTNAYLTPGSEKNCENEGGTIEIPGITDDPCIACFCSNGSVRCEKQMCKQPQCYLLIKSNRKCCGVCQDCYIVNSTYPSTNDWHSYTNQQCSRYNCMNGVFTVTQTSCYALCKDPLPPSNGSCCPSCQGCRYQGKVYADGLNFTLPGKPCVQCVCKDNRLTCFKRDCPVLACKKKITRRSEDGCCLECVGTQTVFNLGRGDCWFRQRILHDREERRVSRCTSCICQNGTTVCERQSCPVRRKCTRSERIYREDQCCPICPNELFLNCTDKAGKKYIHRQDWSTTDDPCRICSCDNGTISCREVKCSQNPVRCTKGQILQNVPGRCCKTCIEEPGICSVFGDPHYRTFDGRPFNFQGDCKYMLAKDCLEKNFTVVVQNDAKRSLKFSWTKTVFLRLFATDTLLEMLISLHQHLVVKLNGLRIALPYITSHVTINLVKGYVQVRTQRGVFLVWDGDSYLEVGASPKYRGALCGLCGNFNGFARDDFIGGDGLFRRDKMSFAESWRYGFDNTHCTRPNYKEMIDDSCGHSLLAKVKARESCLVFKKPEFYPCYHLIDPTDYYKSCLTDVCGCPRKRKCSCESVRAYTAACARRGVDIAWNRKLHCKKTCPRGKVFSTCGPSCKLTCKNYKDIFRNKRCQKKPCVAGCHCRAGYVLHKKRCVKTSSCPRHLMETVTSSREENLFYNILMKRDQLRNSTNST